MMKKITPLMTKNPERESVEAEGSEHSDSLGNSKEEHTIFFRKDVLTYQTTKEGTFVSTSKYRKDKSIRPSLDGMLSGAAHSE